MIIELSSNFWFKSGCFFFFFANLSLLITSVVSGLALVVLIMIARCPHLITMKRIWKNKQTKGLLLISPGNYPEARILLEQASTSVGFLEYVELSCKFQLAEEINFANQKSKLWCLAPPQIKRANSKWYYFMDHRTYFRHSKLLLGSK